MKARFILVAICSIPMAFMVGAMLAQETLPKAGEQTAETVKQTAPLPVVKGDCYKLAQAAKAAREKATAAHTAADDATKRTQEAKAALEAAEKAQAEAANAEEVAEREAIAAEASARETIAACLAKVRAAEQILSEAKPKVKAKTENQ